MSGHVAFQAGRGIERAAAVGFHARERDWRRGLLRSGSQAFALGIEADLDRRCNHMAVLLGGPQFPALDGVRRLARDIMDEPPMPAQVHSCIELDPLVAEAIAFRTDA